MVRVLSASLRSAAAEPYVRAFGQGRAICSSVEGILAVVAFLELALNPFRSPNLSACPLGILPKMLIPVLEMPVDGSLRRIEGMVIAIVDDRSCHTAKDRLDDVEKLCAGGQRCSSHNWVISGGTFFVPARNLRKQFF